MSSCAPTSCAPGPSWFQYPAQLPPATHQPLDRISYYDTPTHTYLIATNSECKDFRLIKFTKDDERLDVHFANTSHDRSYMVTLVQTLKASKVQVTAGKARGILGFVRFTKGYYILLITKRVEVARLGPHRVFEVRDTVMLSLCEQKKAQFLRRRTDEDTYRDHFLRFELGHYFYYSHTYDLTNTLQSNMTCKRDASQAPVASPNTQQSETHLPSSVPLPQPPLFGTVPQRRKFIWNEFLLEPVSLSGPRPRAYRPEAPEGSAPSPDDVVSPEYTCSLHSGGPFVADAWLPWIVFAIRGCVAQCVIETSATPVTVILIGRTSKNFAGARYLRRGVNDDGHVANHVEVEQIAYLEHSLKDLSTRGRLSSYVQVRGSVPVHWFHAMVQRPKPPILLGKIDPFYTSTRLHLQEIMSDFGAPVVLMNLLKCNEKKRREGTLTSEYLKAFRILTAKMSGGKDELPLRYHAFDLRNAAERAWNSMSAFSERDGDEIGVYACDASSVRLQSGVVRSNCVDCIDRTNLAQFFFGFHAFGKQLTALGILHAEVDVVQSHDAVYETLLRLYLRLGDAIAIQYGGSAQVGAGFLHRGIGWDKLMGIRRLYNNLVVDKDKQLVTNLFLGLYEPCPNPLRLGSKLTLPLHRRAIALNASAAAAAAVAEDTGGGADAAAWDGASTIVDDATAFAMRRVVDINEIEADYYLHCSGGPALGSIEGLQNWWVAPLAAFDSRYAHLHSFKEETQRLSRYSRRQKTSHSHTSGSNTSSFEVGDESIMSPRLQFARPPGAAVAVSSGDSGDIPVVKGPRCVPYFLLTSEADVVCLTHVDSWRKYAVDCWLTDRKGRSLVEESDDDIDESPIADLTPQPFIHATNSRTTSSSNAVGDNPRHIAHAPRTDLAGEFDAVPCDGALAVAHGTPEWECSPTAAQLQCHNSQRIFVVSDPEPVYYWNKGPDFGKSCELVHNHQTFPDEVHHSLYKKELDELRKLCDRPPSKDVVHNMKLNVLTQFGSPLQWDVDTVCDALCEVERENVLPSTLVALRQQRMTGAAMMQFVQFGHFRQGAMLRDFVTLIRSIPVPDEGMIENYLLGPAEPEWMQDFLQADHNAVSESPPSAAVAEGQQQQEVVPCPKEERLACAVSTTMFLQLFLCDQLHAGTAERFVRFLVRSMSAPPEDWHDRRKLRGGVPRFDRLRHHDHANRSAPEVEVLYHTFWASTAIRWIICNSKRLGMNIHRESTDDDKQYRAGEFFIWLMHAGIITSADVHGAGAVGVDVSNAAVKDVLTERSTRLFTLACLHAAIVANVPMTNSNAPSVTNSSLVRMRSSGTAGYTSGRHIGGPTTSFQQVPGDPRALLHLRMQQQQHADASAMTTRASYRETFAQYSSGGLPGSLVDCSVLVGQHAVQFGEVCANLAIAALSLLDEQTASSIASAESAFAQVSELAYVDLSLMNSDARLCFFINIFNCLYIHAWILAMQSPSIDLRRFMRTYSYNIGGYTFSLHEIKHGILRRNRPGPCDVLAPFDPMDDPRLGLIPAILDANQRSGTLSGVSDGRSDVRVKILMSLIDVYLTPERASDVTCYNPRNFMEEGSSVANTSIAHPIVYEDGFEIVSADSSSDDEADANGPSSPDIRSARDKSYKAGGGTFFASLFRGNKPRVTQVPVHFCITMIPQFFLEQLNSVETSFMAALHDVNQPLCSVNGSQPYPKLIQTLIGHDEVGRTPEDVMRTLTKRKRKHQSSTTASPSHNAGNRRVFI